MFTLASSHAKHSFRMVRVPKYGVTRSTLRTGGDEQEMNMSSKPTRNESADAEVSYAGAGELAPENSARDEEIRRRAYDIYLERGEQPDRELDDWLEAEHELEHR